jgi:adenine-specific DNA-methyltransferase
MNGESFNINQEQIDKLKSVFPEVVTEGKIDWEKLQVSLGRENAEFNNERYVLNWAGKSEAFKVLQQSTTATLKPVKEESINFDTTENVFIEGENLEVLKVLQKAYYGKIKCIIIDPPYNTGNDSFIYPDSFKESKEEYQKRIGDIDEEGYLIKEGFFRKNSKDSGHYHSNWLSMMFPRLFLSKNLLRDDGIIFVHIDDNEVHNLRLLMNEIYGEENFVSLICVKMSHLSGVKMSHKEKKLPKIKEFILIYAKNKEDVSVKPAFIEGNWENVLDRYDYYVERDDNINCKEWQVVNLNQLIKSKRLTNDKEIYNFRLKNADKIFRTARNDAFSALPQNSFFEKITSKTGIEKYIYNGEEVLFASNKLKKIDGKIVPADILGDIWTDIGINNLHKEGYVSFENGKKPIKLEKRLINLIANTNNNDIVLDFFGGSGTIAQSILELDEVDNGNRKFIVVQLAEPIEESNENFNEFKNIAQLSKARISRTIRKIENEKKEKPKLFDKEKLDLGFKVFKLSSSNFKIWRSSEITEENLVTQLDAFTNPVREGSESENMLYELILKAGYLLTDKIESKGKYYSINNGELIIALEEMTQKLIDKIIIAKPKKVITLDKLFTGNDQLKTNTVLQMKDAEIDFKTI